MLSFRVYPSFLSFLLLVHLSIRVYTGPLPPYYPLTPLHYPFLIALIAKSTHFRNDDWSILSNPLCVHPPLPSGTPVHRPTFSFSLQHRRSMVIATGAEKSRAPIEHGLFAGFSLCLVMERPCKRRSMLRDLARGIVACWLSFEHR